MLKLIFWFFKMAALSLVVLILGSLIRWDGRTLSDQIKTHLSHAESEAGSRASDLRDRVDDTFGDSVGPYFGKVRDWAGGLVDDMKKGSSRRPEPLSKGMNAPSYAGGRDARGVAVGGAPSRADNIPKSERQKLRALIQELNRSSAKN